MQLQQQALTLFQQIEKDLKTLANSDSRSKSSTIVKNNIKICTVDFLQNELPKFKGLHKVRGNEIIESILFLRPSRQIKNNFQNFAEKGPTFHNTVDLVQI
jgi:hypothetical protein